MIPVAGASRIRHRRLVLQANERLPIEIADWADTLVVVLGGEMELICRSGRHANFAAGTVLTLDGMPARTLRNPGTGELVLHLVRRHR